MDLITVPALGGPERRIAQHLSGSVDGGMCWLPIANRLVLSNGGLVALDVDSRKSVPLTDPGAGKKDTSVTNRFDAYPTLSPDGRYLAFTRTNGIAEAPSEILVLKLDSKQQPDGGTTSLTSALQGVGGMAWAPDGKSLIVSALSRGSHHLFRVRFPAGKIEPMGSIVAAGVLGGGLSISATAHNMALAVSENDTDIWRVAGPGWPESQPRPEPKRFIASTRDDVSPDYSADGKRIAFESRRTGSQEIWSVDSEGHDAVQVTNFGGPSVGTPRWSPDGSKIAFDSRKFGKGDIFVVGSNGGAVTRLTSGGAENNLPAWSSDGKWVFFGSNRSGRSEIWKMPADGGQATQVTREGALAVQRAAGQPWIYWWAGEIFRMSEAGGTPEKVMGYGGNSSWAPWKEGIVCFADFGVASVRLRDHKATMLQHLPHPESPRFIRRQTMAVSPDGRWVLLTMTALDRGDLILVENVR
jgi:dipeptidyl aminopeptidase/acylaminoacyl peptidase